MTSDMKRCVDCDASFKRSRCDRTVRCPDCRASAAARRNRPKYTEADEREAYEARCAAQADAMRERREAGADYSYDSATARRYFAAQARYESIREARA